MKTIISLILLTTIAYAYDGKTIGIVDGDTVKILSSGNLVHKVRLYGIDAPEKSQSGGQDSKKALSELIFSKTVNVEIIDNDRYGGEIGEIYSGNVYINEEMVKEGWAWHYVQFAKNDKELEKDMKDAQEKKLGIWADGNAVPP